MSLEEQILEVVRTLPPDKQAEVLHFAGYLSQQPEVRRPLKSGWGALAHLGIDVSDEDIREMRREAWRNFPRELPAEEA